jgi:hypothetical protein
MTTAANHSLQGQGQGVREREREGLTGHSPFSSARSRLSAITSPM